MQIPKAHTTRPKEVVDDTEAMAVEDEKEPTQNSISDHLPLFSYFLEVELRSLYLQYLYPYEFHKRMKLLPKESTNT